MGHKRQYLPGSKSVTKYDLLLWEQHARKLAQFQTAQQVRLITSAITSVKGTTSHDRIREAVQSWTKQMSMFARLRTLAHIYWKRIQHHGLRAA